MRKNETDIFEGANKSLFQQDNNFFLSEGDFAVQPQKNVSEKARRLNDYDFNLLKEDAYKDVTDDLFKLEYKISKVEKELNSFDLQIQSAREIGDYNLIEDLNSRKNLLQEDYEALVAMYNEKSLSARISDKLLNLFGSKLRNEVSNFQKKVSSVSEVILSRMPKQFASVVELKKSLSKLENLNKSVDELISMNIPYGENINKYEQLSKYIIKANSIQSEITRYMKDK